MYIGEFCRLLRNFKSINVVHRVSVKVAINISVPMYYGDKQIALAAMFGLYTPISYTRMQS